MSPLLRSKQQQKRFRICSYLFGIKTMIRHRSSLENHTRLQTKMDTQQKEKRPKRTRGVKTSLIVPRSAPLQGAFVSFSHVS